MKAIILAAGSGSRMQPLTASTHKTLLKVGDQAIIDRIIKGLRENDVKRVVLVTGYRAEELEAHVLQSFPDVDFTFVRNEEYARTNNIQSLAMAFDAIEIDEDIVLMESDLIYEPAVLRRLIKSDHENVALVDRYRLGLDGTVVALTDDNVISQVIPGSLQGSDFSFAEKYKTLNIYKFSRDFCNTTFKGLLRFYSSTVDDNCYYELILGILIYMRQVKVHAEVLSGELWVEVDDPNDLRSAEFVFMPSHRRKLLESSWGGYWNTPVLDFAFIRNMHFPPASLVSQLKEKLPELAYNYGSAQWVLDHKLANFLRCDAAHVHFLNGAAQFFSPTLRSWFDPQQVLLPSPTFGEYTRIFPGAHTYDDAGMFDADTVLDKGADADLIVVVNPNNPTGTTARTDELKKLIVSAASKTVLVDESFIDFCDEESLIPWLEEERYANVIVLKSLSKVLGVPGLRIGFAYTVNESFGAAITNDLPVWNVNSVAEHFIELLPKYPRDLSASFAQTKADRAAFMAALRSVDLMEHVADSGGNFVLVRLGVGEEDAAKLAEYMLLDHGIYVKSVSSKFQGSGTWWRLAVRTTEENRRLCQAIEAGGKRIRL